MLDPGCTDVVERFPDRAACFWAGRLTTVARDDDTDQGGVPDGEEDDNRDGRVDEGETDPNMACDDNDARVCSGAGGCSLSARGAAGGSAPL